MDRPQFPVVGWFLSWKIPINGWELGVPPCSRDFAERFWGNTTLTKHPDVKPETNRMLMMFLSIPMIRIPSGGEWCYYCMLLISFSNTMKQHHYTPLNNTLTIHYTALHTIKQNQVNVQSPQGWRSNLTTMSKTIIDVSLHILSKYCIYIYTCIYICIYIYIIYTLFMYMYCHDIYIYTHIYIHR